MAPDAKKSVTQTSPPRNRTFRISYLLQHYPKMIHGGCLFSGSHSFRDTRLRSVLINIEKPRRWSFVHYPLWRHSMLYVVGAALQESHSPKRTVLSTANDSITSKITRQSKREWQKEKKEKNRETLAPSQMAVGSRPTIVSLHTCLSVWCTRTINQ